MSKNRKPLVKMISLKRLNIYSAYQRYNGPLDQTAKKHIKILADNWSEILLDPLVVVQTGPEAYDVIEGGRRFLAAKLVKGVTHLACRIVEVDGEEARARIFVLSNENRRAVAAYDMYRAGLIGKNPMYCKIKNIVEANGYTVGRHAGPNKFTGIVALRGIVKANSTLASKAFEIAAGICDPENISHKLLKGLFVLLLDSKGLRGNDITRLRFAGQSKIEHAIKIEQYEAPKGCNSAKVYANGIRRVLRRRKRKA